MTSVRVLIQSESQGQRQEIMAVTGPISIGRHAQCVLRLESDLVSRQHAVVQIGPQSILVEDVSTNGTLAGGVLLKREAIEVPFGTPVVLGDFTVAFFPVEAAPPPPPPGPSRPRTGLPPMTAPPMPSQMPPHMGMSGQQMAMPGQQMPGQMPGGQMPGGQMPGGQMQGQMPGQRGAPPPLPAQARGAQNPALQAQLMPSRPRDEARKKDVELRREIHKALLEHLDLATIDAKKLDDPSMRPKVLTALRLIVNGLALKIPPEMDKDTLIGELSDEALGLGPLERFLSDPKVSEIMVVDPNTIYIENGGKLMLSEARFTDDERVRAVIERIVTPLGRRIDESSPLVDARLKDGSRVNAVIKPIALRGACITIRKFSKVPLTLEKLVGYGSITTQMGRFLTRCVVAKKNIVISGGTGSGKTTLLNVLSGSIPEEDRIVTIEDAAELQLQQPHVVALETRSANLEGRGEYTIRDLVKNALRMRPDRIVVGECRGGEALDMLQAMNTGHDGSMTTTHANSPREAINRLETLVLMSGLDLPVRAIREQIAGSVNVIVQQSRLSDGSRKVTAISEITGMDRESGEIELRHIFAFVRTGTGPGGKVVGEFRATGYLPSFLDTFIVMGLVKPGEPYV